MRAIKGLAGDILHQERTALIEHQLWSRLQKTAVDGWEFPVVGMSQDGCNGTIECQRFALEFTARMGETEVGERLIGVSLALPTEIHVEETVLIKPVGHPGMTRSRA